MSDTYCPFPWIHFSSHTDGTMRICCNTNTNDGGRIYKDDGSKWLLSEIDKPLTYYNSQQLKQIRLDMINGQRPSICNKCFMIEDAGGASVRTVMQKVYPMESVVGNTNSANGELDSVKVKSLDFSWGNKCNLKCKMCGPSASDQLVNEFKKLNFIQETKKFTEINLLWGFEKNKSLFELLADDVEEILVTGGEPLVNNDFYKFCLFLIERGVAKNITLKFHTNLTVTPSKFFDVWSEFKCIRPNISIDGVGKLYEYVRYPAKWSIVSQNIEELLDLSSKMDIYIDVHSVFSSFNAHDIPNLIEYFSQYGDHKAISAFPYTIWVDNPAYANSQLIPQSSKNRIEQRCISAIEQHSSKFLDHWSKEKIELLRSNLVLMQSKQLDATGFYKFNAAQDQLREFHAHEVIPWITHV